MIAFGYWTPLAGGWLRNVADEQTPTTFEHVREIAQFAERHGFDVTLVPELNLNDQKGMESPRLDAWTIATALAASTKRIEIMAAVRPGFHNPAIAAKQAATIDQISRGRFTLNVVSAWWEEESRQYGAVFAQHAERYRRTEEFVAALRALWEQPNPVTLEGEFFPLQGTYASPKPSQSLHIYAGGESEDGRASIASFANSYVTHGGTPEEIREKIADLNRRRVAAQGAEFDSFGMAAFVIVRDTEEEAQEELRRITTVQEGPAYASYQQFVTRSKLDVEVSLEEYSVSNRGLRPRLVGTPQQVAERIVEFSEAGLGLLLLQFSPHLPELQRFATQVIPLVRELEAQRAAAGDAATRAPGSQTAGSPRAKS
ncbi:LLM class flavin-dependent oxidoreductase [Humidisolicoccus flavus]|uniref:LLM class flavin-dependent oxidoreductase n=1 Tax=Humidisolicoccus flavus TaxID=3111414 RepID=UPI003247223A